MLISFGPEWAPAFRELADISQIIFTVGPLLLAGIFLIIKIKSIQQDEDILYNLIQLEPLGSYNRNEILKIDRSDIPVKFAAKAEDTIAMANYGKKIGLPGKCFAIKYHKNYVGIILIGKAVEEVADPVELKGSGYFRVMGFFIQSKYQGLGIGTTALQKAIDEIYNDYGPVPLLLECHKDNEKALAFYEKNGFVNTGIMNKKDTDWFMVLK